MAELVPVTVVGVLKQADDGPERGERYFIMLDATAADDARRLLIGVGDAEATALALTMQHGAFPRPLTYQFAASLVEAAGSAVRSVRITERRDGIFYAKVMLRGGAVVDARPSDAINLAAVTGAPVLVASDLLGLPDSLSPRS